VPDILIKDLPVDLHKRLKMEAALHHRSMNQEIRQILESHLARPGIPDFKPFVFAKPLTDAFIREARREGRA
jgi:plasmid stability protein